jgi:hypothetical protein
MVAAYFEVLNKYSYKLEEELSTKVVFINVEEECPQHTANNKIELFVLLHFNTTDSIYLVSQVYISYISTKNPGRQ